MKPLIYGHDILFFCHMKVQCFNRVTPEVTFAGKKCNSWKRREIIKILKYHLLTCILQ